MVDVSVWVVEGNLSGHGLTTWRNPWPPLIAELKPTLFIQNGDYLRIDWDEDAPPNNVTICVISSYIQFIFPILVDESWRPNFCWAWFYPLSTLWYFDLAVEHHHVARLQRNRSRWGDELLSHGHSPVTKNPCLRGCNSATETGKAFRGVSFAPSRQGNEADPFPLQFEARSDPNLRSANRQLPVTLKRSVKSGPMMTSGAFSPDCPAIPGCTRNQNKVPLGLKLQEFGYKNKGKILREKI